MLTIFIGDANGRIYSEAAISVELCGGWKWHESRTLSPIFHSSRKFAESCKGLHDDPIVYLLQFQESEITRILIASAVTARIVDDRDNKYLNEHNLVCGELIKDLRQPENKEELFLREACNKIIHADKIHFDTVRTANGSDYMEPIIYYYGQHRRKKWKATLYIEKYVLEYVDFVSKFNS